MQTGRSWIQLRLVVPAADVEATEAHLFATGALAVSLEDDAAEAWIEAEPGEPPAWRAVRLTALFEAMRSPLQIQDALRGRVPPATLATAGFETLADRDWSRAWMERWKPQRFGRRLWICPTWERPPEPQAVNLRLDPGSAFGTGTHATTALCLEWLESTDLTAASVVDYGCGSGVLAIAALLLGASRAWACDVDRQALRVVAENAARNGVEERLWIGHPTELRSVRADVVVANISSRALVDLAPELLRLRRAGGSLVVSGILEEQVSQVEEAYAPFCALRRGGCRDGWVLLEATLPARRDHS